MDRGTIGKRLRELRGDRTIQEVADATGLAWSNICSYELGTRRPSDENKVVLANFYNVSIQSLFFDDDMAQSNICQSNIGDRCEG